MGMPYKKWFGVNGSKSSGSTLKFVRRRPLISEEASASTVDNTLSDTTRFCMVTCNARLLD